MPNINQETIKRMLIIGPPKNTILLFNGYLNPIFQKINLITKENQKLTEIRDTLLPLLMNGQVKVN